MTGQPYELLEIRWAQIWFSPLITTGCTRRVMTKSPLISFGARVLPLQPSRRTVVSQSPRLLTMDPRPQRPKRRDTVLSSLNVAIETMNIANDALSMTPAKAALGSVTVILTMIRVGSRLVCGWLLA